MPAQPRTAYGTEPPGPGWISAGEAKWLRTDDADPRPPRVAIVGGGPGGMFACYILNARYPDAKVTIYESSGRLGGKIKTDRFGDGTPFEAGVAELYEYLGPGGKDPLRLLIEDDLGLETADMEGGAVVLGEDIYHSTEDLDPECRRQVKSFYRLCAELMPLDKYANRWQPDNAHPWANHDFRECLHEEVSDSLARHYIETAIASDLATESWTCNGLNAIKNALMDNPRYMQLYHVLGGIGRVASELEDTLDAKVKLEHRVTGLRKEGDCYMLTVRHDGTADEHEFDAVIVALPNHWLRQIAWGDEALCEAIHEMLAHYDLPAHYLRVSLNFETDWWRRLRIPGDFWMMDILNGCCVYNESYRWRSDRGHVLSFLMAGGDALLMCSANQSDEGIVEYLLDCLPEDWQEDARNNLLEAQVDRYVGSINAQPGGFPAEELEGEHQPEPKGHPGLFLVGDYLFDSTLNAALMSASTAVRLLLGHLGVKSKKVSKALRQLEPDGGGL